MARRLLFDPQTRQPASHDDQPPQQREPIYGEVILDATVDETWDGAETGQFEECIPPDENGQTFSHRLRVQAYRCGEVTIRQLVQSEYLSEQEGNGILQSYGYYINDLPDRASILDLIAFIVWIKLETKDEKAVREMENLTRLMASAMNGRITHCGFAHLTETPIELYQAYPRIYEVCSTLMCPAVQAHEGDFFNIVSVNPITAASAGLLISKLLEKETGVQPFAFVLTTNSNAWTWLCEKHFGSERV